MLSILPNMSGIPNNNLKIAAVLVAGKEWEMK